jgi:hypothetical protein
MCVSFHNRCNHSLFWCEFGCSYPIGLSAKNIGIGATRVFDDTIVPEIGATRVLDYSIGRFIVASILALFTIFAAVLDAHKIEDARLFIIEVIIRHFGPNMGAAVPLD